MLAVAAIAALLGTTPLAGQRPTPQEIIESQRRLDQIRRERAELRAEMSRIRSRVSDLSSELSNVERQVATSADLLDELENQLSQRQLQIEENTLALAETRGTLEDREDVLHRRLREIYKRGPLQTLQVLLAAESFSDLLNRYKYLLLIARHDRALAEEVATLERQLVTRERGLRSDYLQLETAQRERADEIRRLQQLRAQQGVALTNVRTREQTTAERLDRLARDEQRTVDLIAGFETARRAAERAAPPARPDPGAPVFSEDRRGTLAWPVRGPILYGFGDAAQVAPAGVLSRGVGIAAAAGTPVRAAAAGIVALAGPFEGYGPTVVISHGGGYYSLYLYLADLRVNEGARVESGQLLGAVGPQRTAEGPRLEFQIRVPGGQAVDPLPWLQPQR